jgi:sialate O-acetylesterase
LALKIASFILRKSNKYPNILKGHPGTYKNNKIRLIKTATRGADTPASEPVLDPKFQSWQICEPKASLEFSATGYFFGINLQKHIDIPIGLIHSCVGGTRAESWTPIEILQANEGNSTYLDEYQKTVEKWPENKIKWEKRVAAWEERKRAGTLPKGKWGRKPGAPWGPKNKTRPSALYNAMLAPLFPYPIKGAIWYQGEANARKYTDILNYRKLLPDMYNSWRRNWGMGNFPFLIVQLAPYYAFKEEPAESKWAAMRKSMTVIADNDPNAAMACIIDGGMQKNIHPPYKEYAGARLALKARKIVYKQDLVSSGPTYKSFIINGEKIEIMFENTGKGLEKKKKILDDGNIIVKSKKLKGFAICGKDKKFYKAKAKISGDNTVVVWSKMVKKPVAVRYGWADFPVANLYNRADLPTLPFRTDKFDMPKD